MRVCVCARERASGRYKKRERGRGGGGVCGGLLSVSATFWPSGGGGGGGVFCWKKGRNPI